MIEKLKAIQKDINTIYTYIFKIKSNVNIEDIEIWNMLIGDFINVSNKVEEAIKDLEKKEKRRRK